MTTTNLKVNTILYDIVTEILTIYKESDDLHKTIVLDLVEGCLKRKRAEEEEEETTAAANPGTSRFVAYLFNIIFNIYTYRRLNTPHTLSIKIYWICKMLFKMEKG